MFLKVGVSVPVQVREADQTASWRGFDKQFAPLEPRVKVYGKKA
jgi:hypothetical protein